jgi:hypothetical protein
MNNRLRHTGAIKPIGLAAILALLIAIFVMLDPSKAPAADMTPTVADAATPIALPDEPGCVEDELVTIDPSVDLPFIEDAKATPVVLVDGEDVATDPCDTTGEVAVTPEETIPNPGVDSPSSGVDESTPTPEESEPVATEPADTSISVPNGSDDAGSGDPTMIGLPIEPEVEEPVDDPLLTGIPVTDDDVTESEPVDPMLAGFSTEAVEAPLEDPFMFGIAEFQAAAKPGDGIVSGVVVDITSEDGTIMPGGQVTYTFTVTNTNRNTVHFQLEAITDLSGWVATMVGPNAAVLNGTTIMLKSQEVLNGTLVLTAPTSAIAGSIATTTMNAVDNH